MAYITNNKELSLLLSRIDDITLRAKCQGVPQFIGFLDTNQQSAAISYLKNYGANYILWGGAADAERCFLGIFAENQVDYSLFPICCLEFSFRPADQLTHRDFLGSFMALGLRRETIGDIIVSSGSAVAFVTVHAAQVILSELNKIGKTGVSVCEISSENVTITHEFAQVTGTVASLRMDCIVAFLCNTSRSAATKLISGNLVFLNGMIINSCDKNISQEDKISIRSYGKFIFEGVNGTSKKDKLKVSFKKYQ